MKDLITKEKISIENKIYNIRGKQVMLDSDLALLYECANGTKTINQSVKRHQDRFPNSFMFQLTENELQNLWSQTGTAKISKSRTYPYAFTEEGVAMLSSVLRTSVAAKVSVDIMHAFVAMRHYISDSEIRLLNVESKVLSHDNDILLLKESFNKLNNNIKLTGIYYKGQIYEAYSALVDIVKTSTEKIIIIDNYVDKTILDILTKIDNNIKLIIICDKETTYLKDIDINKYNEEYNNLNVIYNKDFHDRFIIIDNKDIYHCGSSINRLGHKTFAINKIDDITINKSFINKVKEIINKI